jgi:hypothetical protein
LILTDILKALYQPHKVFKQIVQNPKYLGALVVLIIFVAAQTGFYYTLYSKTYYEQTSPEINNLGYWTLNSSLWSATTGAAVTHNFDDFINSSFYGNSSLQFELANSKNISVALTGFGQVDCSSSGFQNLSLRIKTANPQAIPEKVSLTLYSLKDADYFQYDLTSNFSNSTASSLWNNLTAPVGSGSWQSSGSPQWRNITALKLDFVFPAESNITLRLEGVFFRGIYKTPMASDSTGFLIYVLQAVFTQFLFQWLLLGGLLYIIVKVLKGNLTWKPLFVAVGFALIVTAVLALINIAATLTVPSLNYPVELLVQVPGEAQALSNVIATATATYTTIAAVIQLAGYVWLAALNAFILRALVPEFSWSKSILASAISLVLSIILLSLLGV